MLDFPLKEGRAFSSFVIISSALPGGGRCLSHNFCFMWCVALRKLTLPRGLGELRVVSARLSSSPYNPDYGKVMVGRSASRKVHHAVCWKGGMGWEKQP
jgi:hypothetical protein